jgi:hypothetical protein
MILYLQGKQKLPQPLEKKMRIQSKYLDEKLTAADPTSKWISDFVASDNPRFADKSKKERINMALGASYAAKGQSTNEETHDSGWKEAQTAAKTKNVAQNLARKAMKQEVQKAKDEKGFGPSPANKLSIRKEEIELDELSKKTLGSYISKAAVDMTHKTVLFTKKAVKRMDGIDKAVSRMTKEEVELDEGKYGAFRIGPKRPKYPHVPQGDKDPRTGLPLGFSPIKDEPKKVKEEVELDELDQSTLTKYATRAKFSSDPKRREGAAKAQEKINKKSKDMQKEEVEELEELTSDQIQKHKQLASTHRAIAKSSGGDKRVAHQRAANLHAGAVQNSWYKKGSSDALSASKKLGVSEDMQKEEVDESIGSTVGGLVGQYAGSKLGMEGPGRSHGELAGRAIEYHVRKFANRLKKKITGKNESVEEDNKAYRAQDKASRETTGMSLPQRSKMYDDIQKKLKDQEEEYRKQGILPPKNEEVELEEAKKKGLWDNIHAKRKRGERPARPGERGYPKTLNIESSDLDEAGKLQGGGKDPCWTGYKMVGTKKKGGREVPNCVPREGKEYKSFKALREELNGNSNRS